MPEPIPDPAGDTSGTGSPDDASAMRLALAEAARAVAHGDVPVGAVVLHGGEVVASRHNERELQSDPTAHAEVLALRDAAARLGTWRLDGATVVVTLEPCPMCAGALVAARVGRLVFGAGPQGRGVRVALPALRRPPAQPRAPGDPWRAGRRGLRAARPVLRGPSSGRRRRVGRAWRGCAQRLAS